MGFGLNVTGVVTTDLRSPYPLTVSAIGKRKE